MKLQGPKCDLKQKSLGQQAAPMHARASHLGHQQLASHGGVCVWGGRPVHCCVSGTQQGLSLSLGSHIPSLSPAAARTHLVVRCTTKTGLKRLGGVGSCVHVVNPCACPPHACVHTAAPRLQQGAPAGLTPSSCNWGVSPTHMGPLKEDRGGGGEAGLMEA